jgi:hypothetical protein
MGFWGINGIFSRRRGRFFDRIAGWAGFPGWGEGALGGAGPGEEEDTDEG